MSGLAALQDTGTELLALDASTLHEAQGARGWLGPAIGPLWPGSRVAGPCRTVWTPAGDNLGVHMAVERARPGEVLCVASSGGRTHGGWGEVLARAARARGIVGVVVASGVRDIEALAALGFPAFGRGRAVQGTSKRDPGRHQVTVPLGAAVVAPGDWVVGDEDGVVVIAASRLDRTLAAARARVAAEGVAMTAIERGATSREALGIRAGDPSRPTALDSTDGEPDGGPRPRGSSARCATADDDGTR